MTPEVQALYTPEVRARVAAAVGLTPDDLQDLGGFESFVHACEVEGQPRIVKATWSGRRTPEEMGAELHFVSYLADGGAEVCRPLPLASGELQQAVPCEGAAFHVTTWEKAPGRHLVRDEFSDAVLHEWGAFVGRLHRLSANYPGPPAPFARRTWQQEFEELTELVRPEPVLHERFQELLETMAALPTPRSAFGAMHGDLHRANIHWHDGQMKAFDFEDLLDFWFVSDLAIVLFYAVMEPVPDDERQRLYDRYREHLLAGYATEYDLPQDVADQIPLFLRLREQLLRAVMIRSIPEDKRSPGAIKFLQDAEKRILSREDALGLRP